jgi:hypothetical protein
MSRYLQHYVDWGLSQIVFISRREKEGESGYNLEITWETVVARKGQEFVEVVVQERVSFAPNGGGSSVGKDSERPMDAEEYRKAAKGKPILYAGGIGSVAEGPRRCAGRLRSTG